MGWKWDLECLALLWGWWRPRLSRLILADVYFLALSKSFPKQFAKSKLTIFILRSVIFKNENINFYLKKRNPESQSRNSLNKNCLQKHPSFIWSLKTVLYLEAAQSHRFGSQLEKQGPFNLNQLKILILIRVESISPS